MAQPKLNYGFVGDGSFGLALDKFSHKLELHMREKVTYAFFETFEEIVHETPVDTTRAQKSWKMNVKKPDLSVLPLGKKKVEMEHISGGTVIKKQYDQWDDSVISGYASVDDDLRGGA